MPLPRILATAVLLLAPALAGCLEQGKSAEMMVLEAVAATKVRVSLTNTGSATFSATYNGFLQASVVNSTVYHPVLPRNATEDAEAFPTAVRIAPGQTVSGRLFFSGSNFPFRLVYAFDNIRLEQTVANITRAE